MTVDKKTWSVLHNKAILTSIRRMFPYILGKFQIEKRQTLIDCMDFD